MGRKESIETAELRGEARGLRFGVAVLLDILKETRAEADITPLSLAELEEFAQAFPQWEVETGIRSGRPFKTYSRTLHDVEPSFWEDMDSRLSLIDAEHFDPQLSETLGGNAWSGAGEKGAGRFAVNGPEVEVGLAITAQDWERVLAAEQYLMEQGITVPQQTPTAA